MELWSLSHFEVRRHETASEVLVRFEFIKEDCRISCSKVTQHVIVNEMSDM